MRITQKTATPRLRLLLRCCDGRRARMASPPVRPPIQRMTGRWISGITPNAASAPVHSVVAHPSRRRVLDRRFRPGRKTTLGRTGADNPLREGSHPPSFPYKRSAARELPRVHCARFRSKARGRVSCRARQMSPSSAPWRAHHDIGAASQEARRALVEQPGRRPTQQPRRSVLLSKGESSHPSGGNCHRRGAWCRRDRQARETLPSLEDRLVHVMSVHTSNRPAHRDALWHGGLPSRLDHHLDRLAFVHCSVAIGNIVQLDHPVEDTPGLDPPCNYVRQ
jgi:hypothetical protein